MFSNEKLMLKYITSIFRGSAICSGNSLYWSSPSYSLSFSLCIIQFCRNGITITWKGNRKKVLAACV